MLPWLKNKTRDAGAPSIIERTPDEPKEDNGDEGLRACARDLIDAISSGDEAKVAAAIKAAFEICDSNPSTTEPSEEET